MWPDNTLGESSKTAEISKAGKGVGGGMTAKISKARKQKGIVARKIGLIRICLLNVLGQKRCSLFQAFIFNKKPET